MNKRPSILFLLVDALRADRLKSLGGEDLAANMNTLGRKGCVFNEAYACANHTNPSLTSIFSGLYPPSHGIIHQADITNEERMRVKDVLFLAEMLKSNGYVTLGVVDFLGQWLKKGFTQCSGSGSQQRRLMKSLATFFVNHLPSSLPLLRYLYSQARFLPYSPADTRTDRALDLIDRHCGKQFFLYVHYSDPHFPYSPPHDSLGSHESTRLKSAAFEEIVESICFPPTKQLVQHWARGLDLNAVISRYDGEVAFVDHEIGRILTALDEYGILDQVLIILTADHGESLGEHNLYFAHQGLYDATIHVPLILKHPDLPTGIVDGFVQHVDIVPTIFDLLNIKYDASSFDGKSVLPLVHEGKEIRPFVYAEETPEGVLPHSAAIRTRDYKYIKALSEDLACKYCKRHHIAKETLYDLKNDPDEMRNIAADRPDIVHKYQLMLQKMLAQLRQKEAPSKKEPSGFSFSKDEEKRIRDRLRKLGYVD